MAVPLNRLPPPPGLKLCEVAVIPDGGCVGYRFEDGERPGVMICRSGEQVWAYMNICPHLSLPLDSRPGVFMMDGPEEVMCAFHCAVFRFSDGLCVRGPARSLHLDTVPIEIVDGHVVVKAAT
jgi:nitrite reductase/ring-hydroxylating ferredoxin subunit